MERLVVVVPRSWGSSCIGALLLIAGCSIDRTPQLSAEHRISPISGRVPPRTATDRPGNEFGEQPTPSYIDGGAQLGGLQCNGLDCPFTSAPIQPCCTTVQDIERGAAREADRCGLDFSATSGNYFSTACWQRDQPGVLDDRCPSVATQPGVEEPGCCTDDGACGGMNTGHALGCHYELDGTAAECGEEDIVPDVQCNPLGVFGVRSVIDVAWGGRDGGLAALTDDGRNTIVIHLKVVIESIDGTGAVSGSVQPCGVELPPFYSTTLCESYQPQFPTTIWESPKLPKIELMGRYQCLSPGCILTMDPQTYLLGINLENPEAPWPAPQETFSIACAAGSGVDCFPDHDADSLPGLSVTLRTSGMAPPGMACMGVYDYDGAPLSSSPAAIFDGVRRTDQILLGTRVKLGGAGKIAGDCNSGAGQGVAEFVQSRGWGCMVQEGTQNFGGPPAGPDEFCMAAEAAFMDENLPIYNVLRLNDRPGDGLAVTDTSPSVGPQHRLVRLGALNESISCEAVRTAAYPTAP